MTASQTTPNESNTDHTQSTSTNTNSDSIDADIVQTLNTGDIITATHLTRRQHQQYLKNPDSTLADVYYEETDYLVLNTPNTNEGTNVFAAKIIRLEDYNPDTPDHATSPYSTTGQQTWNITTPRAPYNNEGTGALISRLGDGQSIITHIIRDISITDNKEL